MSIFCLLALKYLFTNLFWPCDDKWGSRIYLFLLGQILVVVESLMWNKMTGEWLSHQLMSAFVHMAASQGSADAFSGISKWLWNLSSWQNRKRKQRVGKGGFFLIRSHDQAPLQLSEWFLFTQSCLQLRQN